MGRGGGGFFAEDSREVGQGGKSFVRLSGLNLRFLVCAGCLVRGKGEGGGFCVCVCSIGAFLVLRGGRGGDMAGNKALRPAVLSPPPCLRRGGSLVFLSFLCVELGGRGVALV